MAGPIRPLVAPALLAKINARFVGRGYEVMRIDAYGSLLALLAADQNGALHEFWVDTESGDTIGDPGAAQKEPGTAVGFLVVALTVEVILAAALIATTGLPLP